MTLFLMVNSGNMPHTQYNTYRRCCFFIYLLVLLTYSTASQHRLTEGVEGGSVVLPCSHSRIILEEKQLTVYWRHNDTRNVYDIIHGEVSVKEQHPAYKNRAKVLPEHFKNSQIFLKLTDLQLSDGGTYICFVPDVGVHHSTQLEVKERRVTVAEPRAVPVRSHATETSLRRSLQLLLLLPGLILPFS